MSEIETQVVTASVHWDLHYDIHLGATWSRFMAGLRDRVVLADTCPRCEQVFVPPQAFCERCFVATGDWRELPAVGTVEAYTVAHVGFAGGPPPPYVIAAIRLDGASTLLMHRLSGLDPEAVSRGDLRLEGLRVEAVWAEERTGEILDIAHFTPVDG